MTETTNLSFSYKVKEELSAHFGNARHCQIAELSAIVNICGGIASFGKTFCLKIHVGKDRQRRVRGKDKDQDDGDDRQERAGKEDPLQRLLLKIGAA